MLGLPKTTELNKQLPKSAIYARFQMDNAAKARIDKDISRIYIVNEVSAARINLNEGEEVKSFFVMSVLLKRRDYDEKNIITLSKLIPQNMVMVLEYGDKARLAVYRTRLIQTDWMPKDDLTLELTGLNLDRVWENIIRSLEGGVWNEDLSLDENLALHEKQAKLEKEIARLEKLARAEKQPKRKFELAQQVKKLKGELK